MRFGFTKLLVVLGVVCGVSAAQAGFHFEPYLGFGVSGTWEQGSSDGDMSQTNYGVKLGYQAPMGFQVGGDIQLGTGSIESGSSDLDYAALGLGAYVGYQSMMGVRGYLSYLFNNALALDSAFDPIYTGSGIKLGVGYRIIEWFAVNLEYHMMTYDEYETSLGSTGIEDLKTNVIAINVSFPFNFGGGK